MGGARASGYHPSPCPLPAGDTEQALVRIPQMTLGSRLSDFIFTAFAEVHEREVIRAEQKVLSVLIEKGAGSASANPSGAAARLAQAVELKTQNVRRLAQLGARLANRIIFPGRVAFLRLPASVRRSLRLTAAYALAPFRGRSGPRLAKDEGASARPSGPQAVLAVPFGERFAGPTAAEPLGVVLHIFYPELASEIRDYLENAPGAVDLYISTDSPDKRDLILQAFSGWTRGRVDIRVAPNRGRDIAPKLVAFRDVYDRHTFVLHLHSKKSPHESDLKLWRYFIFENLLGDQRIASDILAAMERNPEIGMIASDHYFPITNSVSWGNSLEVSRALAMRMGVQIDSNSPLDFPSGSMFWIRSAALKPLLDLNLSVDDFHPEERQIDGTLAHAVERLYFYACEIAGLKWIKVCRPEMVHDSSRPLARFNDEADLQSYLAMNTGLLSPGDCPHAPS